MIASKITREDNTYVKLEYDSALRVKKESYYNAANVLTDETIYTYDAAGKRMGQKTNLGQQTYEYTAGYQLDKIREPGDVEDYDYDANGRLTRIERDGRVLDLAHDVYDRLTTVENETSGATIQYGYDSAGRRISATDGSHQWKFLVTPVMGSGLESTDLMTDGAGNLISNYIYAGGSSPFMRLDANGSPVYYLTDGMGSVIGLADGAGTSAAKFGYDVFGGLRFSQGMGAGVAGGDFRFQGQWLESATGIYHFRARDYDARTGTFLSRDPVDPTEQDPEALNPYQAMYNNPYVYSDPTGAYTLSEVNAASTVDKILQNLKTHAIGQAKQYLTDKARGLVGDIAQAAIKQFTPLQDSVQSIGNLGKAGNKFEDLLTDAICGVIGESFSQYLDHLWFEPKVSTTGMPLTNGFDCGDANKSLEESGSVYQARRGARSGAIKAPRPDFIVKQGGPASTDYADRKMSNGKKSYLVGDFKITVDAAQSSVMKKTTQWQATLNYARYPNNHQYAPITIFFTFYGGKNSQIDYIKKKALEGKSAKDGVLAEVVSLIPTKGR